ncbi:hypothetical protein [Chroococcidiopsis sp.]|uniref:hypothetical protein n=1 Tax=Chroococcidiopsis sp. TaxID=3088168 RepID=UPI003F2B6E7C
MKSARKAFDFYPTETWASELLINRIDIQGNLFECCSGQHHITKVLRTLPGSTIKTNDINPDCEADYNLDLSLAENWKKFDRFDWVITNPPFKVASPIVQSSYKNAKVGVAMLLRLSFLEACENRKEFLMKHPPTNLIVLPRMSFTADRKTDSVTCAWMIWDKRQFWDSDAIQICSRD